MPETRTDTPKDTTVAARLANPRPGGATATDTQTNARRDADATRAAEEARTADNTARRQAESPRPPTARELRDLTEKRFGKDPGSILVDTDLATGASTLVYRDGDGQELAREPFRPEGPAAPTGGTTTTTSVAAPTDATAPTPVKPGDRPK